METPARNKLQYPEDICWNKDIVFACIKTQPQPSDFAITVFTQLNTAGTSLNGIMKE